MDSLNNMLKLTVLYGKTNLSVKEFSRWWAALLDGSKMQGISHAGPKQRPQERSLPKRQQGFCLSMDTRSLDLIKVDSL